MILFFLLFLDTNPSDFIHGCYRNLLECDFVNYTFASFMLIANRDKGRDGTASAIATCKNKKDNCQFYFYWHRFLHLLVCILTTCFFHAFQSTCQTRSQTSIQSSHCQHPSCPARRTYQHPNPKSSQSNGTVPDGPPRGLSPRSGSSFMTRSRDSIPRPFTLLLHLHFRS